MIDKVFFDTNILVYSVDKHDPAKQEACRSLLKATTVGQGVISTQILQEFYVSLTRKIGIDPMVAKEMVHSFEHFETLVITPGLIRDAIDCSVLFRLSFWDSLVVVAAENAQCTTVYTEDMNHGQTIRGIRIRSPFK